MLEEVLYLLFIVVLVLLAIKCIKILTMAGASLLGLSAFHICNIYGGDGEILAEYGGGSNQDLRQLLVEKSKSYKHSKKYVDMVMKDSKKVFDPIETTDVLHSKLPYQSSSGLIRPQIHIGQRKLFLNELQFLTHVSSKLKKPPKYCVYAGSAPSNKTHYLSQLFPQMKFILVDPNQFDIVISKPGAEYSRDNIVSHRNSPHADIVHIYSGYEPNNANKFIGKKIKDMSQKERKKVIDFLKNSKHKIYIIEDYMDNEYSEFLSSLETVFVSDIRSNVSDEGMPTNYDIYWNSSMMFNWITIMRPELSMLKFRIPYVGGSFNIIENDDFKLSKEHGIDFERDMKKNEYHMPKSVLYIQPWAGRSSNELRMWILKKDLGNIVKCDMKKIDNQLFYYNAVNRGLCIHKNENASRSLGFCLCNDCALENKIWVDYFTYKRAKNIREKVHKSVIHLGNITTRPLSKVHYVNLYKKMTPKDFITFAKEDKKTTDKYKYIAVKEKRGAMLVRTNNKQKIKAR